LRRCIDEHGGDDERTKIIALARLVDSDAFNGVWRHSVMTSKRVLRTGLSLWPVEYAVEAR